MNREIEFRGKNYAGEWVYGNLMQYANGDAEIWEIFNPDIDTDCRDWAVIPESVGQYTGLKDKNGAKIWEGDVLKAINPNGEEDNLCVVKWDNLCGGYPYVPQGGFGDFDVSTVGWAMTMEFTFEIIGNKWDDSSLLLGGKKDDS